MHLTRISFGNLRRHTHTHTEATPKQKNAFEFGAVEPGGYRFQHH